MPAADLGGSSPKPAPAMEEVATPDIRQASPREPDLAFGPSFENYHQHVQRYPLTRDNYKQRMQNAILLDDQSTEPFAEERDVKFELGRKTDIFTPTGYVTRVVAEDMVFATWTSRSTNWLTDMPVQLQFTGLFVLICTRFVVPVCF
eukprot:m.388747 g.388747  ORF g.388747 m.388747 type:complete len:147 (+) comp20069_c0_seq15:1079-1519(+)